MKKLVICLVAVCLMNPLLHAQKATEKKESGKPNAKSEATKKEEASPQKKGANSKAKSTSATKEKSENSASGKKASDPKKPWIRVANTALKKKAADITKKLKTTEKRKLLKFLNEGKPAELAKIPGIGKSRAENLTKGRPYKAVDEIVNIAGIGEKTFEKVAGYVKKL